MSTNRPTLSRNRWLRDLQKYRMCAPGSRNSTLVNLALRGRSLEIAGVFLDSETYKLLISASWNNGYVKDEGIRRVHAQITHMRKIADETYNQSKNNIEVGVPPKTPLVTQLVTIDSLKIQISNYLEAIYASTELPNNIKRMLYIVAVRQLEHPEWDSLIVSTRAIECAAHVSRNQVGKYWRTAEKLGFISFTPGVDYETAKALGVSSRSSEISLNLDTYSSTSVPDNPRVDLDSYREAAGAISGYVKYRRSQRGLEKQMYLINSVEKENTEDVPKVLNNPPLVRKIEKVYLPSPSPSSVETDMIIPTFLRGTDKQRAWADLIRKQALETHGDKVWYLLQSCSSAPWWIARKDILADPEGDIDLLEIDFMYQKDQEIKKLIEDL